MTYSFQFADVLLDTMISLAEDGMTMLCVTHEMGFARSVADRVIFMADGRIVEQAPPQQFFAQPEDPRLRAPNALSALPLSSAWTTPTARCWPTPAA